MFLILAGFQRGTMLGDFSSATPAGWTFTKSLPEKPAQVCLVRKADAQSDITERVRTGDHQMTGLFKPPPHHVSMRRFSEGLFERTREVRRASLRDSTEIPGVDRAVQIPFD